MSAEVLFYLFAGAAAGGLINGLAGFGTALFALGLFLTVMPPVQAVAIVLMLAVSSGLQGLWVVRREVRNNPRRLLRFLLPALVGIPLGIMILSIINPTTLKLVIAVFLILYGGFFTFRRTLPRFDRPTPVVDALVGFAGGVLGGAASLSGALPTMWCSMRPWPKNETRAVLQPYNVVVLLISALILAFRGAYTAQTLLYLVIALPISICMAHFGLSLFKRLKDDTFRRLLVSLTLVSGVLLLLREAF